LLSIIGRQGVAYRHVIFRRSSHQNRQKLPSPKIAVVDNPNVIWRRRPGGPPGIYAYTLYFRKLESLGYIFVADSMGLSSLV